MKKYGITKTCLFCGSIFNTKPKFIDYCSQKCKNPLNRGEYDPWNKGLKLTEEQKAKQNREGLKKGQGWNKGIPNEIARKRFLENNPNKDGRLNNLRSKKYTDSIFEAYKREVRKATYRSRYAMQKEGLIPDNTGKRKTQYQLDHIIPYRQGFELGIDPKILGSRKNLRWILGEENRKKWDTYQPLEVVNTITGETHGIFKSLTRSL